jgi:hypothetical protein
MAEDAELIGGISVTVGASHSKLVSDLAEADRLIEQWAKQKVNIQIGGQFTGVGGAPAQQQRATPVAAPSITVGAGARTKAQAAQAETNLQKAINAELAKTGESYNAITGEIESATGAIVAQRQVVASVQQQASQQTPLNIDTKSLQNDLQAVLVTLKEIVATAAEAAGAVGSAAAGGGTGGGKRQRGSRSPVTAADVGLEDGEGAASRGPRRKNIRDRGIGTEADPGRIYTFDPKVYEEEERQQEARASRQREQVFTVHQQRAQVEQQRADARALAAAQAADERSRRQAQAAARANQRRANQVVPPPLSESGALASQTLAAASTPESRARDAARRRPVQGRTDVEERARQARDQAFAERANQRSAASVDASGRAARGGGGGRPGTGGGTYRRTDEDIDQREAQRVAIQEAQRVSAGRTARTQASGLGGFFGGGRALVQAQAALAAANEKVVISQRRLADPEVQRSIVARRAATEELVVAQNEQAEALKKVESFAGIGAGARNLLAVTAAGAAFGIGLQAISTAFAAAEKAATPYFDAATGYADKTRALTGALADQARQQQGNAQGVTELRLASAGFAASTAGTLQPIIAQRTQIEAGNKALVEQIETFRIAENLRKQGATAGIGGGGTGGVLGTSLFGIPSTGEQTGNFLGRLNNDVQQRQRSAADAPLFEGAGDPLGRLFGTNRTGEGTFEKEQAKLDEATAAFGRGLQFVNNQLVQGGKAATQFAQGGTASQVEQTAAAFDQLSPPMAQAIRDAQLYSSAIAGSRDPINAATEALRALNLAGTLTGPAEQLAAQKIAQQNARNSIDALRSQQAYERPGFMSGVVRQQGIAQNQLSAQEALGALANPAMPVGTGRAAANAREQRQINRETRETQAIQNTLNQSYAEGMDILQNTYRPAIVQTFGAAAGQVFDSLLGQITQVGQQMAATQAAISNKQAAYQVAQYNYQLYIAQRTLADIGGLTGKNFGAGKSYLGVLEGQNLALSRQAQLLQFGLSQRQINFQKAVAGFTVPGLTPAEQNARVQEAKIEAEYAQKQLNIQKQMFQNQVKIVDIQNLRQGADLVKQIALLQQGRQVTIDTQAAQEKLDRLNKRQQQLVARVGTYITAIDQVIAKASADMAAQEAILGRSLTKFETQAVAVMYNVGRAFFSGLVGGLMQTGATGGSRTNIDTDPRVGKKSATGNVFMTQGTTQLGPYGIAGEAGGEAVASLSHPKALTGFGGGGDGSVTINFNGDNVFKTEADFQRMYRMVVAALGREASTKGLRTPF